MIKKKSDTKEIKINLLVFFLYLFYILVLFKLNNKKKRLKISDFFG